MNIPMHAEYSVARILDDGTLEPLARFGWVADRAEAGRYIHGREDKYAVITRVVSDWAVFPNENL